LGSGECGEVVAAVVWFEDSLEIRLPYYLRHIIKISRNYWQMFKPVNGEIMLKLTEWQILDLINRPAPLWLPGVDLSGTNLSKINLNGAILEKANLSGAYLSGNIIGANLSNADLSNAKIVCDLSKANLIGANLSGADLQVTNMHETSLIAANLSNANLSMADLFRACLHGANLTETDLKGSHLKEATLTNANLTRANLTDADLTDANLTGANLTGTYLKGANLTGANLTGANLADADMITDMPYAFDVQEEENMDNQIKSATQILGKFDIDFNATIILCPVCGYNFQHTGRPIVRTANTGYKQGVIAIPMKGECGSEWEFCIGEHKGQCFAFINITKPCTKD